MSTLKGGHEPVLVDQVMANMGLRANGVYLDGTFGLGGHTSAMLATCPQIKHVIGVDCDRMALQQAIQDKPTLAQHARQGQLITIHGRWSEWKHIIPQQHWGQVDGMLLDVGVCSMQIDMAARGFSYRRELDARLDMRMDQSREAENAYDIVNQWPEARLAQLLHEYGEERHSRAIARHIITNRRTHPIQSTWALAKIVNQAFQPNDHKAIVERLVMKNAQRTFQALRMQVNQEPHELEMGLQAATHLLKLGGKLVVIAFHSGEDRIVKRFLKGTSHSPHLRPFECDHQKVIRADTHAIQLNPRAKAAKLRVGTRTHIIASQCTSSGR